MTLAQQLEEKGYQRAKKESMTLAKQLERQGYEQAKYESMTLLQQKTKEIENTMKIKGISRETIAEVTGLLEKIV